ncbi:MAG TPA: serine protease [Pyrinomonadaceae bacterium]|jgi:V8-like Glu-specific endopeptidase
MGVLEDVDGSTPPQGLVGHYKKLLKAGELSPEGNENLESPTDSEPDLSDAAIKDRLESTRAALNRIVKEYLGDSEELREVAEQIVKEGGEALRVLRGEDDAGLAARGGLLDGLEAIVRTDGSRPSFMVRNAAVDLASSPAGNWENPITVSADLLAGAVECVGRIDVPGSEQGFEGTGFLVHENLIITNRHVLQVAADWQEDRTYKVKQGAAIDFGHEFRARRTVNRRALRRVVYCGRSPIVQNNLDHKKLDLALIELEPADDNTRPSMALSVELAQEWAQPGATVYAVGYPADPGPAAPLSLLETLFRMTYGHKRLAPGLLMSSQQSVHTWTLAHDATTLGGNSGSVILVRGREHTAAGLHYGGRWGQPRENWGHVLASVLDEPGLGSDKTLREHFVEFGVSMVDSFNF